jgi:hypothetical protein
MGLVRWRLLHSTPRGCGSKSICRCPLMGAAEAAPTNLERARTALGIRLRCHKSWRTSRGAHRPSSSRWRRRCLRRCPSIRMQLTLSTHPTRTLRMRKEESSTRCRISRPREGIRRPCQVEGFMDHKESMGLCFRLDRLDYRVRDNLAMVDTKCHSMPSRTHTRNPNRITMDLAPHMVTDMVTHTATTTHTPQTRLARKPVSRVESARRALTTPCARRVRSRTSRAGTRSMAARGVRAR